MEKRAGGVGRCGGSGGGEDRETHAPGPFGIVGYGDIGQAIAERARSLSLRVLALRRTAAPAADPRVDEWIPQSALRDLMSRSDYVAVALPSTDGTRRMIDAPAIAAMKPTAVFVNVGLGATVDESAL